MKTVVSLMLEKLTHCHKRWYNYIILPNLCPYEAFLKGGGGLRKKSPHFQKRECNRTLRSPTPLDSHVIKKIRSWKYSTTCIPDNNNNCISLCLPVYMILKTSQCDVARLPIYIRNNVFLSPTLGVHIWRITSCLFSPLVRYKDIFNFT